MAATVEAAGGAVARRPLVVHVLDHLVWGILAGIILVCSLTIEHFFQLGTRTAQLVQGLDMKAHAARTVLGDADGQGNELFVLGADAAFSHGGLGELPKAHHGVGLRFSKRAQLGVDVLDQGCVIEGTHGGESSKDLNKVGVSPRKD